MGRLRCNGFPAHRRAPTRAFETQERDLSVFFLDTEGYARISEKVDSLEPNQLLDICFSAYMDAIYGNNQTSQLPVINIGIKSGPALVGATKIDSYTASRWT